MLLGLALAASAIAPADAALVRYDFTGTLTTSDTASEFAADAGLASGSGSFSGYAVFDSDLDLDPAAPELYESTDFLLEIGAYSFSSANSDFANASVDTAAPGFTLTFGSFNDFSSLDSEFMNLTLSFNGALAGLANNPVVPAGSAVLDLFGVNPLDANIDTLGASGEVEVAAPVVPEPATWLMFISGFLLIGTALRSGRPFGSAAGVA